jgi:hypothetical protein
MLVRRLFSLVRISPAGPALSLPSSFVSFFSHLIPRRLLTLFRESITSNQIQSEKNQVEEKYSILQGFNFDTFARLSAKTKS